VAHIIRRWLWRANGLLALGVLAVWTLALTDDPDARPLPQLPRPQAVVVARPLGPDVPWAEMVSLCRAFHGWGEGQAPAPSVAELPSDGRLPLAAYKLMMWAIDPGGPDSILLKSKDPAHLGLFLPKEGQPDQGVAIERVERRGRRVFITVSRGAERFTHEVADRDVLTATERRFVRIEPTRSPASDRTHVASDTPAPKRVDVKVLPFFGSDGSVSGARVTGVRAGSAFARAGLRAGDVIVSVDEESFSNVDDCRARLSNQGGVDSLRIRDGAEKLRRLVINS
jgi:membrane-associated protease RseP (regulator of RpoE activity)